MTDRAKQPLEQVRQRVIDRLAALMESQTRTKIFGSNLAELISTTHGEMSPSFAKIIVL